MSQNNCECNDYSQVKASTGIAFIKTANPNLNGSGNVTNVLVAGANGTMLKSVIVKSIAPTVEGMVRLFIKKGTSTVLIKEIPVPTMPTYYPSPSQPITGETFVQPMFVAYMICNIRMESGDILAATTQNESPFTVIAEGLDLSYPDPPPSVCCSFRQSYPNTGIGTISVANPALDGSGTIEPIFTADPGMSGSVIKSISIEALSSTSQGIVRLFISRDSVNWALMNEISIPTTIQASSIPAFQVSMQQNYNLAAGYVIGASTQNAQQFGISIQAEKWTYATI